MHPKNTAVGLYPEQRPLSALTAQTTTSRSSNPSFGAGEETLVVNHQKALEEDDLSYRPHTGAGATTLTNTSAVGNLSFSEYEDLLLLAQQHFDDLRRTLTKRPGESHRPGSSVIKFPSRSSKKTGLSKEAQQQSNQLLSTLLYLSLMMNKVEEVKSILKQVDINVYNEWSVLITFLHPPPYYIRERRMQADRAKRIYQRKVHYKRQAQLYTTQLQEQQDSTTKAQKQASDTFQQMSTNIARLMEETAMLRAQLFSKEQVETELSNSNAELNLLQAKVLEAERQHELLSAEMTLKIKSYEEALIETANNIKQLEEQKLKSEVARLLNCHEQAIKDISDEMLDYKSQCTLLEEKLEQKNTTFSQLQDQANDTAQKMSASITWLMEEAKNLRSQLAQNHDVEVRLSAANKEVESLRSKLEETTQGFEQLKVECQLMKTLSQQALTEANENLICACDRAAKSETELLVTKKALAETSDFLAATRKDLNDAKDSLAKAIEMHAEKTENEMKIEENLQQVTKACRHTTDLLNMMDAKLDGFQTSTKTSTSALEHDIEHSNTVLDQVCHKVSAIESVTRNIASSQDMSCVNNEKRFDQLNLSLDEIAAKAMSINSAQDKTFSVVCNIACKNDEIASDLTTNNQASNLALNEIQIKLASLGKTTDNIANLQDDATKCMMDTLHSSSSTLVAIDDSMRKVLVLQDSTAASVEHLQTLTGSFLDGREMDKKELNVTLGKIHETISTVEICTKDIASVQADVNKNALQSFKEVADCLASIKNIDTAISSLQDVTVSNATKLEHLGTSLNEKLLLTKSSHENESLKFSAVLDQIHDKVSNIDESVNAVASAQEAANDTMTTQFQNCSSRLESISEISNHIQTIQDSTAIIVTNLDVKAESLLAAQSKDAKEVNLSLENINNRVSDVLDETKIAACANSAVTTNLAKNIDQLGVSLGSIEACTKSILSLNEATSLSVSNLERVHSSVNAETLSNRSLRESEVSNLQFTLDQIHGKISDLDTTSTKLVVAQASANDQTCKSFQQLGSLFQIIDNFVREIRLAQQAAAEGIDNLDLKTDSLRSIQEKDAQEINTALKDLNEKVSVTESNVQNSSKAQDSANAIMIKKIEQFGSTLSCIEADTKLINMLREETSMNTSVFERLNNCLNEQLMLAQTSKGKDVDQLNVTLDQIYGEAIKVGGTMAYASAEDAVSKEETKGFEQSSTAVEDIHQITRRTQGGQNEVAKSFSAIVSDRNTESSVINQEKTVDQVIESPISLQKETAAENVSTFHRNEHTKSEEDLREAHTIVQDVISLKASFCAEQANCKEKGNDHLLDQHTKKNENLHDMDLTINGNLEADSISSLIPQEAWPREPIVTSLLINSEKSSNDALSDPNNQIKHQNDIGATCSLDVEPVNIVSEQSICADIPSPGSSDETLSTLQDTVSIKDSHEVRQPSSCLDTRAPAAYSLEVSTLELLEESILEDQRSGRTDSCIQEGVEDNPTTSEQQLDKNESMVRYDTTSTSDAADKEADLSTTLVEEDGDDDEPDKDVDILAKLAIIHATALVHVGLIQVDAIESASMKIS